jgi:hypothetical protein
MKFAELLAIFITIKVVLADKAGTETIQGPLAYFLILSNQNSDTNVIKTFESNFLQR